MLLQPTLLLTDHGHFQYNCISLGLSTAAAVAIAAGHDIPGSILFSLSLNHKQMGLFFAPAFFAHLLGKCLAQPTIAKKVSNHAANEVGLLMQQIRPDHEVYSWAREHREGRECCMLWVGQTVMVQHAPPKHATAAVVYHNRRMSVVWLQRSHQHTCSLLSCTAHLQSAPS